MQPRSSVRSSRSVRAPSCAGHASTQASKMCSCSSWTRRPTTMHERAFSWSRFVAVLMKEFVQMRRDRLTFAMIVGIPILQLVLFGYAINSDPKSLPTAIVDYDKSEFSRSIIRGLENTAYFAMTDSPASESEADRLLSRGDVQFAVIFPSDFSRRLLRGERPALLVAADATDPAATGNALAALSQLGTTVLRYDLVGTLAQRAHEEPPFDLVIQRRYNAEGITQYNIVP